jgi:hypothetical protein
MGRGVRGKGRVMEKGGGRVGEGAMRGTDEGENREEG